MGDAAETERDRGSGGRLRSALRGLRRRWNEIRGRGTDEGPRPARRRRTPTILQMEAVECGAAALAIVLAHHGRWVALEELRTACGVSRDGSKASNVVKAARRYGLVAKGFKKQPLHLRRTRVPAILHWNFNHFLVLEGFSKQGVHLNDPASGPRVVSEEELDESFTGVVLVFEPGEDFAPQGSPPRLLPALKERLRGAGWGVTYVLLAGLALVVPGLAVPIFTKVFVDGVLLDDRSAWLTPLLWIMGATAFLLGALTWLQRSQLLRLETRLALVGSSRFLWHVLQLPVEFFNQRFAGDISQRVAINNRVAQLLSRDLATNSLAALTVVFYAAVMVQYDLLLTVIGVAVVSVNILVLRLVSRKRTDGSRRLLQEQGKLHGIGVGGLRMIETLKATGGEADLFARWSGYQAKVVNIRQELERYTEFLNAVPPTLMAVSAALILGVGSLRVMDGMLTLGGLVAFQALMTSFVTPVNQLVNLGGKLQTVEGDLARLDDVLRYQADPMVESRMGVQEAEHEADGADGAGEVDGRQGPGPSTPPQVRLAGRLELVGVTFGYNPLAPPLVEGFDLVLEPGARVALVGGSGSGKSTVARLVNGLYEPWEGQVLFDGLPRREVAPTLLVSSVSAVDQSVDLFEGTVRENLTLWDATVPLPEVVAACRDAAIHEDIAARSGGYDSPVAEGGANFSGGQRQRLEIARALVGNPRLLILDEATSALDPATESRIDRALRRRGCTCLIIAHRLSTIRDADEIVVLEAGKVVQRGVHEDLKDADGLYRELIAHE